MQLGLGLVFAALAVYLVVVADYGRRIRRHSRGAGPPRWEVALVFFLAVLTVMFSVLVIVT